MVTSTKGVSKEIASDKVHQKEPPDSGFHESGPEKNRSPLSMLSKQEPCEVQERQNRDPEQIESQANNDGSDSMLNKLPNNSSNNLDVINNPGSKNKASFSNQERKSEAIISKEDSHDMHQRPSPCTELRTCQSDQEGRSVSVIAGKELEDENLRHSPHTGSTISESNQEGSSRSIIPDGVSKISQKALVPVAGGPAPETDQENFIVALRPEKGLDKLPLRRNPDSIVHASHSDEGVTFSRLPEKPTVDGYNWRKYGQKLVRGNSFVRSYYKCTFLNCPARKQVERSHDGHITEINYLWKHEHPKPLHTLLKGSAFVPPIQATGSDEPSLSTCEDHSSLHPATSHDPEATETPRLSMVGASENFVEVAVSRSSEIKSEVLPPDPKRQKREGSSVNDSVVTKTNCEPRVVVQTTSEVDIVNDGYRWRKYGQKLVKGNPNPRSYYRCSSAGCPVKKHVERASHDEKVVITTYEGRHDHDMPSGGRTVTPNMSGNKTGTASTNDDESRPKPDASESTGMEVVVHVSAN